MKWNWKKVLQSNEVILATVVGICLIVKVYIIRHIFDHEVDVNELYIPLIILLVYETLEQILKKRRKKISFRWNHPLYWSVGIVVLTVLSLIPFAK